MTLPPFTLVAGSSIMGFLVFSISWVLGNENREFLTDVESVFLAPPPTAKGHDIVRNPEDINIQQIPLPLLQTQWKLHV